MRVIPVNRLCPFCEKDCGAKTQYYHYVVSISHICKNCNAPLTNDFQFGVFRWKIRNWYHKKLTNGNLKQVLFKKWGEKI